MRIFNYDFVFKIKFLETNSTAVFQQSLVSPLLNHSRNPFQCLVTSKSLWCWVIVSEHILLICTIENIMPLRKNIYNPWYTSISMCRYRGRVTPPLENSKFLEFHSKITKKLFLRPPPLGNFLDPCIYKRPVYKCTWQFWFKILK